MPSRCFMTVRAASLLRTDGRFTSGRATRRPIGTWAGRSPGRRTWCARGLQIQPSQGLQVGAVLGRERGLLAEPEIALGPALAFLPAHLVDGVVDELGKRPPWRSRSRTSARWAPRRGQPRRCALAAYQPFAPYLATRAPQLRASRQQATPIAACRTAILWDCMLGRALSSVYCIFII
jgi:hypothetical protein